MLSLEDELTELEVLMGYRVPRISWFKKLFGGRKKEVKKESWS
jgi:hypothetical protein